MTLDDLEKKFRRGTRIASAEKRMRQWVFRGDSEKLAKKVAEMDELIAILVELKDELKARLDDDTVQPTLLDVPRKAQYN